MNYVHALEFVLPVACTAVLQSVLIAAVALGIAFITRRSPTLSRAVLQFALIGCLVCPVVTTVLQLSGFDSVFAVRLPDVGSSMIDAKANERIAELPMADAGDTPEQVIDSDLAKSATTSTDERVRVSEIETAKNFETRASSTSEMPVSSEPVSDRNHDPEVASVQPTSRISSNQYKLIGICMLAGSIGSGMSLSMKVFKRQMGVALRSITASGRNQCQGSGYRCRFVWNPKDTLHANINFSWWHSGIGC
jgi:hypothetical protein